MCAAIEHAPGAKYRVNIQIPPYEFRRESYRYRSTVWEPAQFNRSNVGFVRSAILND
jgi:hypothetical protein